MIALLTVCVRWGLRITPLLSYVFIIFVVLFLYDPPRGESEGKHVSNQFSFWSDLKYIAGAATVRVSMYQLVHTCYCRGEVLRAERCRLHLRHLPHRVRGLLRHHILHTRHQQVA